MSWTCINPAQAPEANPIAIRSFVDAAKPEGNPMRDGLNWGDQRLWFGSGPRPFNLSPLLPADFELGDPLKHFMDGEAALSRGDWQRGWELYEFRHQTEQGRRQMPRLCMPHWDGKAKPRRLLVHADQGAGDAIMFARYVGELEARKIPFDFIVPAGLVRLMSTLAIEANVTNVIDEHLYDYHIPLESLPLALGLIEPFAETQYLSPPRRVGICWAGQANHARNADRCLTLEQILQHCPKDREIVSLQMGEAKAQLQFSDIPDAATMGLRDWADTAAIVAGLDQVVTVDTGLAHLAGALAVPCKLVLKEPVEWRWASGVRWYDSMEIVHHVKPYSHCNSLLPEARAACGVP